MTQVFDALIEHLCRHRGLDAVQPEDNGDYLLALGDFPVLFRHYAASAELFVGTTVGRLPEEGPERQHLLQEMLQGQFCFHQTAGASLSIDPAGEFVALQKICALNVLDQQSFVEHVEALLLAARFWQDVLYEAFYGVAPAQTVQPGQEEAHGLTPCMVQAQADLSALKV